jgi:hypothetical protein
MKKDEALITATIADLLHALEELKAKRTDLDFQIGELNSRIAAWHQRLGTDAKSNLALGKKRRRRTNEECQVAVEAVFRNATLGQGFSIRQVAGAAQISFATTRTILSARRSDLYSERGGLWYRRTPSSRPRINGGEK